ncbi:MAG: T9SS type A sorting domain-containing protein, partial [Bacteroidia bacterium]|nr:T9SS type A sorting domain-containing protein [Bacteroidia bacterium]
PTVLNVTDSDVFMGESSLLIKNAYSNSSGGTRYGYCFLGIEDNDYYTPHFPIDTFKYLQGYYKYIPDGDDTARINLRTWGKGKYKSNDNFYLSAASDWTFFAFPINYYTSPITADSAGLIFYSGKTDSVRGPNSSLYLDNLELVMQPKRLGISTLNEEVSIYPNPFQRSIIIKSNEINTLDFYNTLGKLIATHRIFVGDNMLDLVELPTGIYYFKTRKQSWTKKVIKQ